MAVYPVYPVYPIHHLLFLCAYLLSLLKKGLFLRVSLWGSELKFGKHFCRYSIKVKLFAS